jgi:PPK2 family polyphosphate:nucleotide phosphotransferase
MSNVQLDKIATIAGNKIDKEAIKAKTLKLHEKIVMYQRMMYAEGKHSLLIIFQGMDASGKDGSVRRIFSGVNPLGCNVVGFKKPTPIEIGHDFLRRIHQHTPERGMIQIFNRSHYEDILVPSVEKYIDKNHINARYDDINNFEKLLADHDTTVLKFYLHISRDEQLERLEERLHNPEKYRKHNDGDRDSREKWDAYMKVYHEIFEKTSTKHAPWHVIEADQNRWKVYQISEVIVKAFEKMNPQWPELETEKFVVDEDE